MSASTSRRMRSSGSAPRMRSYWSALMILRGRVATGGVLTPLPGCRKTTWSLNAVVKIASSTTLHCAIIGGRSPIGSCRRPTHSRTSLGRTSTIRRLPSSGSRYRSRMYR